MASQKQKIEALISEGARQQQSENFQAAEHAYRAALAIDPTHPQALALLGMLAGMFGNLQMALDLFLKAAQRDQSNADLYHNIGETYRHLDEPTRAFPYFKRAIELRPGHLHAYRSAADAALAAAEKAPTPGAKDEFNRIASRVLLDLGVELFKLRNVEAMGVFREAIGLNPNDASAYYRLGTALYDFGAYTESLEMLSRAIEISPREADYYVNLATSLYALRRWDDCIEAYKTALRIAPQLRHARLALDDCQLMHDLYEDAPTAEQVHAKHRAWGERTVAQIAAGTPTAPFANPRKPDRTLRVGFVSNDLRDHPVAQFFRPLLAQYDREHFSFFCYTARDRTDAYTEMLQKIGGQWRIAPTDPSDEMLRSALRSDGIDIAIELAGHTARNRLEAFAVRPAPVTASWLGYPATTGLPTVDWRITDAIADPDGFERYYVERLIRLPGGFLCYEPRVANAPDVSPLPATTRRSVTFGSFNSWIKVAPNTVRCWAEILRALPDARLLAKAHALADPAIRADVLEQFSSYGVEPWQLDLRAQIADAASHLAVYGEVDIGLDPLGYNGTTTTCEALWMGIPTVTLIGDRHVARVGFDLLSRIGLEELAAPNIERYVATAINLANDLPKLKELRAGLRNRMRASPLCDPYRFAREFEGALRTMWRDWCER